MGKKGRRGRERGTVLMETVFLWGTKMTLLLFGPWGVKRCLSDRVTQTDGATAVWRPWAGTRGKCPSPSLRPPPGPRDSRVPETGRSQGPVVL